MTDAEYETGDVVEFEHRDENVRGIVKYDKETTGGERTYSVAVPSDVGNSGYVYKNETSIISKRGHVDYDPQDPFGDSVDKLLAPFRTIDVECDECGDTFHISEAAVKYGTPDYCSEACGINAGNLKEGIGGR